VDETENIIENLGVVGVLLEPNQFDVDDVETFVGLGHEIPQQLVHGHTPSSTEHGPVAASRGSPGSVSVKGLILVAVVVE
jgi:hypothetical protein